MSYHKFPRNKYEEFEDHEDRDEDRDEKWISYDSSSGSYEETTSKFVKNDINDYSIPRLNVVVYDEKKGLYKTQDDNIIIKYENGDIKVIGRLVNDVITTDEDKIICTKLGLTA